jgi:hypothetical protein
MVENRNQYIEQSFQSPTNQSMIEPTSAFMSDYGPRAPATEAGDQEEDPCTCRELNHQSKKPSTTKLPTLNKEISGGGNINDFLIEKTFAKK